MVPPRDSSSSRRTWAARSAASLRLASATVSAETGTRRPCRGRACARFAGPVLVQAVDDHHRDVLRDYEGRFGRAVVGSQDVSEHPGHVAMIDVERGGVGLARGRSAPTPLFRKRGVVVRQDADRQGNVLRHRPAFAAVICRVTQPVAGFRCVVSWFDCGHARPREVSGCGRRCRSPRRHTPGRAR